MCNWDEQLYMDSIYAIWGFFIKGIPLQRYIADNVNLYPMRDSYNEYGIFK